MDERRFSIESFLKSLKQNEDLDKVTNWNKGDDFNRKLLQARDLSEEALAHEVLKNTGVPIPSNGASMLRKEDFYNRVMQDLYPELDSDISFDPKMDKRNLGTYNPNNGKVELSPEIANQDIRKGLSTSIHEQAHKYDDKILKYNMPKTLITGKNADTQLNLDKALNRFLDAETAPGPSSLYEVAAKGHHARIPNLRDADSFGLGALKSMMKSGTFRQVAGALPLAGTALALSSGDASAAAAELPSEIPILGQAYDAVRSEDAGSSADDMEMINEDKARKSYAKSPAHQDRNQALRAQALKAIAKK